MRRTPQRSLPSGPFRRVYAASIRQTARIHISMFIILIVIVVRPIRNLIYVRWWSGSSSEIRLETQALIASAVINK